MNVLIVANCADDGVESMRRFGECLARGLEGLGASVRVVAPRIRWGRLAGPYRYSGLSKWLGYVDKHVTFPRELERAVRAVAAAGPAVAHVADHGNAMYVDGRRRIPWVVTCHDLLAVRAMRGEDTGMNPTWTGRIQQRWVISGLRRADHVACDSAATRDDLLRTCPGIAREASSVIPVGLNHPYRAIPRTEARNRLEAAGLSALLERPYLLHVGSNQKRKNRSGVVRVAAGLSRETDVGLVLAGPEISPDLAGLAATLGVGGRVSAVVRPSNDLLEALYNLAHALLFPSTFEGFGWPVAEAQACGCPVVCSNTTSLPEVAGDAACLHDPDDVEGMIRSLRRLFEASFREGLVARGHANAARFAPEAMAAAYARRYEQAWNCRRGAPEAATSH
jgi:glycosyltransferase involved in cell wall biosynthesis